MYRVVIVEDDPMVSLLNRTVVERDARFQVVQSFQDGRAALAWLEQNPADLAVLDVYMPLFTGLELLHALRGQGVVLGAYILPQQIPSGGAVADHQQFHVYSSLSVLF